MQLPGVPDVTPKIPRRLTKARPAPMEIFGTGLEDGVRDLVGSASSSTSEHDGNVLPFTSGRWYGGRWTQRSSFRLRGALPRHLALRRGLRGQGGRRGGLSVAPTGDPGGKGAAIGLGRRLPRRVFSLGRAHADHCCS